MTELTRGPGFEPAPAPPRAAGDYYLFAIAIDDYNYPAGSTPSFPPLKNPVRDAAAVVDCLTGFYAFHRPDAGEGTDLKPVFSKFDDDEFPVIEYRHPRTFCLYNASANKASVEQQLDALMDPQNGRLGPDDSLVIYFAGHGYYKEGNRKIYLALHDQLYDASDLYGYFHGYTSDRVKCRHFLLILDCCFAGNIALANQGVPRDTDFCRHVITATAATQEAYDGGVDDRHSPFALSLLEALYDFEKIDTNALQVKVAAKLRKKTQEKQTSQFAPLPVDDIGVGFLRFRLKYEHPPVPKIKEKLLGVNFRRQKDELAFTPSKDGNRFNLITLEGETANTHVFATKVLFEQFRILFQSINQLDQHYIRMATAVGGLEHETVDFDQGLAALCSPPGIDPVEYILPKLLDKHILLSCEIKPSDETHFRTVQTQARDFLIRLRQVAAESDDYREIEHCLFIFLHDSRVNNFQFEDTLLRPLPQTAGLNISVLPALKGIEWKDFSTWWDGELKAKSLIENFELPRPFPIESFQQSTPFEMFVDTVATGLGLSDLHKADLLTLLFDINTHQHGPTQ